MYVYIATPILLMSLLLLILFILFSTSMKIESGMLVDMVLEPHPTSPHVESSPLQSQAVRPSETIEIQTT